MSAERLRQLDKLFQAAKDLRPPERAAYLKAVCSGDAALRDEVEALLLEHDAGGGALDGNAVQQFGDLLSDETRSANLAGQRIGPYQVLHLLGTGGMGQVWKARDTRLGRAVAIKFLREEFSERFEREARAIAALNHPNIAQIYDVGDHFLVMEFVDGEALRKPESLSRLVDIAIQIAEGLASAHSGGIIHRDLKPDNIRLSKNGQVKLLDFGIARQVQGMAGQELTDTAGSTLSGKVVGTVAYMSPEQVRGEVVDHRSDIFSFGIVLYELVTGSPLFQRSSATETMAAILRDDVPDLPMQTPLALMRIISHALEKQVDKRFQSTCDMAFALRNVNLSTASLAPFNPPAGMTRRDLVRRGVIAAGVIAAGGLGYVGGKRSAISAPPMFRKVPTGVAHKVFNARFTSDGESVVYMFSNAANVFDLAVAGLRDQFPRELNMPDVSNLLAVSSSNELAVLLKGTVLARMALSGGSPRKLVEAVVDADWMPDGESLAILRQDSSDQTMAEFPIGKLVGKFEGATALRVSPDGKRIVVAHSDDASYAYLTVVEREDGKRTRIATFKAATINAVPCWSPNGREVWLSSLIGEERTIYAFDMSGKRRTITTFAGISELESISRSGRVLIDMVDQRFGSMGLAPGAVSEVDMSLTEEYAHYSPMAVDDKTYAYTTLNADLPITFLRSLSDRQAVRLCDGTVCGHMSPDLRWAPVFRARPKRGLFLVPTGTGIETEVSLSGMTPLWVSGWLSDEPIIMAASNPPDQTTNLLVWNPSNRVQRVFAKGALQGAGCDAKGQLCIAQADGHTWRLYPTSGAAPFDVHGIERNENPLAFSSDGHELFVTNLDQDRSNTVWRLNWATGKRAIWKKFTAPPGRQLHMFEMRIGSGGQSYVYQYEEYRSALYTVDGLP